MAPEERVRNSGQDPADYGERFPDALVRLAGGVFRQTHAAWMLVGLRPRDDGDVAPPPEPTDLAA
eukprot:3127505-Lingulodinium_polyedra.AAC.1